MNKILVILLILLVVFYLTQNEYEYMLSPVTPEVIQLSNKLYNGEQWNHYRLGDVYLYSGDKVANVGSSLNYHLTEFLNSIAAEYLIRNKPIVNKNKKLLVDIVNKRKKGNREIDGLVLHVRIGDVICLHNEKYKHYSRYGNLTWWKQIIKYIKQNKISKVYILSGTHLAECLTESAQYLEFIKNNILKDTKVEYRVGMSPDDDLLFVSDTKHFISTGGGYGKILNEFKIS